MALRRTFLLIAAGCLAAHAFPISVYVSETSPSFCGAATGVLSADVSGGVPPYSYSWSNGESGYQILYLDPGTYTVTVTDANGDQATGQGTVTSMTSYQDGYYTDAMTYSADSQPWFIFYAGDGDVGGSHGPGPYGFTSDSYVVTPNGLRGDACTWYSYYHVSVDAPPGTSLTIHYTDGNGCPGNVSMQVPQPVEFPQISVQDIVASCPNGAIGSARVTVPALPDQQQMVLRLKDSSGSYVGGYCNSTVAGTAPVSHTYSHLPPGDYEAVLDFDVYNQFESGPLPGTTSSQPFTIPETPGPCVGTVNGTLYVDANDNCALNSGENKVPGTLVQFTPGPYYAVTNSDGQYSFTLPAGTYTVAAQHPVLTQSCALQVTLVTNLQDRNVALAPGAPLDVQLSMGNGAARPGFELDYGLTVDNLTAEATGDITLQMTFDPVLQYLGSSLPGTVTGNTITWTAPDLTMENAFGQRWLMARFSVPPDVSLIGTALNASATVTTANTDVDLANNTVTYQHLVTGSYDPNEKTARTATDIPGTYLVDQDDGIDYTIRFQNTGTDTAFTVVVTDTLPPTLDMATVRMGAYSHPFTWAVEDGRVLRFTFADILLPDSNVNEAASHGFVQFHVKPVMPLALATEISNTANIYFDFNDAVITEPCVLTAATSTLVPEQEREAGLLLIPNPATKELMVGVTGHGFREGLLQVLALDGRKVAGMKMDGPQAVLNVADLAGGVYIVQLRDARRPLYQARLVKQ